MTLSSGTGINISGNVISTYDSSWYNVTSGSGMFQVVYNDIYYDMAKVGIGTSTMPSALFHIRGNGTNTGSMIVDHQSATPSIQFVRGLTSSTTDFNWNILNDNSLKIQNKTSTNAYDTKLQITSTGKVGIGVTTTPTYPLDVIGDVNITGEFRKNGTIFTGGATTFDTGAITTGTLPIARGGTGANATTLLSGRVVIMGSNTSMTTNGQFTYNTTTNVLGVGNGTGGSTGSTTYTYFQVSSTGLTTTITTGTYCAIFGMGIWVSTGRVMVSSDIRIKENIQDLNDDSVLQMILAIEPKTYDYIDKVIGTNNKVYGFIAQQIREVIPEQHRL